MKAPSLRYLLALTWLLTPGVTTAGEAPEAQVFGLLMEELSYESRQERLAETFSQLDREGQLTPALYRKLLAHPSGRMFLPDLNAALARSDAQRATAIFGSLLKAPPDLPSDSRLDVQRATAYALSQLTASNRDEQLFALLRQESDLEVKISLARSFTDSRRRAIEGLAIAWSRDLDAAAQDDDEQTRNDPLWGQKQLALRQSLNALLSQLGTDASLAELLASLRQYLASAPGWLIRNGVELLGAGSYQPAYPVTRQIALDDEAELVTRTAALKAMAQLLPPDKKQDLARIARELLAAAEGELEQPEVEAVIEALEEK